MDQGARTTDEWWDYGEVTAVVSHDLRAVVAFVADLLPADDDAFDPIEVDWQAFMGDLEARFGRIRPVGGPQYVETAGVWMWKFPIHAVN